MVSDYLEALSSLIAWRPSSAPGQNLLEGDSSVFNNSIDIFCWHADETPPVFFSQTLQLCLHVILSPIAAKVNTWIQVWERDQKFTPLRVSPSEVYIAPYWGVIEDQHCSWCAHDSYIRCGLFENLQQKNLNQNIKEEELSFKKKISSVCNGRTNLFESNSTRGVSCPPCSLISPYCCCKKWNIVIVKPLVIDCELLTPSGQEEW